MRYVIDHDFHIHSKLSYCSLHEEQTKENILKYAEENGLNKIIITDHYWDKSVKNEISFYVGQDYERLSSILPLPQSENVKFLFGCETDMDRQGVVGISENEIDKFDFIIVPTTHLHMYVDKEVGVKERVPIYLNRFEKFLEASLPFKKVGLAHLTCPLIANKSWESHIELIELIPSKEFENLFKETVKKGCGVELNFPILKYNNEELERILRPYQIAKECGCKFYLGSDAHTPERLLKAKKSFEKMVEVLNLKESDKFVL